MEPAKIVIGTCSNYVGTCSNCDWNMLQLWLEHSTIVIGTCSNYDWNMIQLWLEHATIVIGTCYNCDWNMPQLWLEPPLIVIGTCPNIVIGTFLYGLFWFEQSSMYYLDIGTILYVYVIAISRCIRSDLQCVHVADTFSFSNLRKNELRMKTLRHDNCL